MSVWIVSRALFFTFPLGVLFLLVSSCQTERIAPQNGQEALQNTQIAYAVFDLDTKELLAEKNGNDLLPPASVAKYFVAAYALSTLGPQYRFQTRILKSSNAFYLVGGGDPSLALRDLMEIANGLLKKGIQKIENFYFDESYFQPSDMIGSEFEASAPYNAGVSALSVEYNQAIVQFDTLSEGVPIPSLKVTREELQQLHSQSRIGDSSDTKISRIPIRQGARFTAQLFAEVYKMMGGSISSPTPARVPSDAKVVTVHRSGPLIEKVASMFDYSNNLFAEAMGMVASCVKAKRSVSLAESSKLMEEWLRKEFGLSEIEIVNHSGLTLSTKVSARTLATFLFKVDQQTWAGHRLRTLVNSLGWQARRTGHFLHPDSVFPIFYKSGSLDFVSNSAGYIYGSNGRRLVFAIMTSDLGKREKTRSWNLAEIVKANAAWAEQSFERQQGLIFGWQHGTF